MAGLDIAVARLYGLKAADMCYMVRSFKVLNEKYPAYVALIDQLAKEQLA